MRLPAKAAPDLRLRSEVTAPRQRDRELPHWVGDIGRIVRSEPNARVGDPGRVDAPECGQSRLPINGGKSALQQTMRQLRQPVEQQFEIIGVLSKLYVLMENAGGLVSGRPTRRSRKVLFEELRRRMEQRECPRKSCFCRKHSTFRRGTPIG